jgi:nickel-type superoxide dismutase maturation protease
VSEKKHRGLVVLKVEGISMLPTLKPGAWVVVRWGKEPKLSDVVVARSPLDNHLIIKRLVKIESDGYWLEGDAMRTSTASSSQDSWVFGALTREQILGVVIWPRRQR